MGCLPNTCCVDGAIIVQPAGAQRAPSAWVLHPRVGQGGARCEEVPLGSPLGHVGGASSPPLVFWRPFFWQLLCLILSFCFFFAFSRLSFGWTSFLALLSYFLSCSPSALGLGAGLPLRSLAGMVAELLAAELAGLGLPFPGPLWSQLASSGCSTGSWTTEPRNSSTNLGGSSAGWDGGWGACSNGVLLLRAG